MHDRVGACVPRRRRRRWSLLVEVEGVDVVVGLLRVALVLRRLAAAGGAVAIAVAVALVRGLIALVGLGTGLLLAGLGLGL